MKRDLTKLALVLSILLMLLVSIAIKQYVEATKHLARVHSIQETVESQFEGGAQ
jgi:hypothetical protein